MSICGIYARAHARHKMKMTRLMYVSLSAIVSLYHGVIAGGEEGGERGEEARWLTMVNESVESSLY